MAKTKPTDREIDAQIARATERARESDASEPRAISAHYDDEAGKIVIELASGATFSVPVSLCEGFANANPRDLRQVRVSPSGEGLHWDNLDVHLGLTSLMTEVFGTRRWIAHLGRLGGRVSSVAKAAAARANGTKGGRPTREPGSHHRPAGLNRRSVTSKSTRVTTKKAEGRT